MKATLRPGSDSTGCAAKSRPAGSRAPRPRVAGALAEIRSGHLGAKPGVTDMAYAEAFRRAGIDVDNPDPGRGRRPAGCPARSGGTPGAALPR